MDRTDLARIAQAFDLAARAHSSQRRKGHAAEPYVNHLSHVARRISESESVTPKLLVAAILHDIVEDTNRTRLQIEETFGVEVAELVAEVSDDKTLAKEDRKERQVAEAPGKSPGARRIKLADKASNVAALVDSPPREWDRARLRAYVDWAARVVDAIRGTDPVLESAFDREARRARKALDE